MANLRMLTAPKCPLLAQLDGIEFEAKTNYVGPMGPVPFVRQSTTGGCGACSLIMVAQYFFPELALSEEEALQKFGYDGHGPRCFVMVPSFGRAGSDLGLVARVRRMTLGELTDELRNGPVIAYHKASEAPDALPHFSVVIGATADEITRHDPALGPAVIDTSERFERIWAAAKVDGAGLWGCHAVVMRPKP